MLAVRVGWCCHCCPLHSALLSCIWCCHPAFSIVVLHLALLSCIQHCHSPCSSLLSLCYVLPLLLCVVSLPHCDAASSSLVFVLCHRPHCPCCPSSPPFSIPVTRHPCHSPLSSCHHLMSPHSTIVSTSISPHEQWLMGRVVALCDMALIAALQAEACSSGIG